MSYKIRMALTSDLPQLVALVAEDSKEGYAGQVVPNEEHLLKTVGFLVGSPDGFVQVAILGEKVVGILGALKHVNAVSGEFVVGELFMWVAPEHRDGRGPGVTLVRNFLRWGEATGAKAIQVTCPAGKPELGKVYEALGFEPLETQYQRRIN